jgi:hypothetical protein
LKKKREPNLTVEQHPSKTYKSEFTTVGLLRQQHTEIRELIFNKPWLGFRSVAEFVREAVRKAVYQAKMEISAQEITRKREEQEDWE